MFSGARPTLVVSDGAGSASARPTGEDTVAFAGPDGAEQTLRFVRLGGDAVSHAFHGWRLVKRRGDGSGT